MASLMRPLRGSFLGQWALLALVLAAPGLWNGYPLLYPDTCRYLKAALNFRIDCWSPVAFPVLARPLFLFGPWAWMLAQCAAEAAVLLEASRWLSLRYGLLLFAVILSGHIHTASLLLMDIYFPMAFLTMFLYLESGRKPYCPLILLMLTAHMAVILIAGVFVVLLLALRMYPRRRLAALLVLCGAALCVNMAFTYRQYHTPTSPCQPAFLAARFVNDNPGFFQDFCAGRPEGYFKPDPEDVKAVCQIAAETRRMDHFLWNPKSPIQAKKWLKGDGSPESDLGKASAELKAFSQSYIRSHPLELVMNSVRNVASYFLLPRTYLPTEVATMHDFTCLNDLIPAHSLQRNGNIAVLLLNKSTIAGYFLAMAVLVAFLVQTAARRLRGRRLPRPAIADRFCLYAFLAFFCSGLVTANLSALDGRYQQWAYIFVYLAAGLIAQASPPVREGALAVRRALLRLF